MSHRRKIRPLMKKGQRVVMLVPGVSGNQDQGCLAYDEPDSGRGIIELVRDDGVRVNAMSWEVAPIGPTVGDSNT